MTIYTLTYNESLMLPYFIRHYRDRFPNCKIVVYDNQSTDDTVSIAQYYGCEVRVNDTGGTLDDMRYLEIKNNCWKGVNDWVIIADCDEFVDIWAADLEHSNIYYGIGYNMVNMFDTLHIDNIDHGVRAISYDKLYCFHSSVLVDTNYNAGAHTDTHKPSDIQKKSVNCHHYKYINPDYMVKRHAQFAKRLCETNKKRGFGGHYQYSEQQIRAEFEQARQNATKIK